MVFKLFYKICIELLIKINENNLKFSSDEDIISNDGNSNKNLNGNKSSKLYLQSQLQGILIYFVL